MKLKVLHNWVLVHPIKEDKTVGGLKVYKDKDRYVYAEVFKVGENISYIKEGEFVYFDKSAGQDITFQGKKYKVLKDESLVMVSSDEDK